MDSGWMITASSIWITRSLLSKSRGVFFISSMVVKVMKFSVPFSTLGLFWVRKL